jgi:HEAT repeats
MRAAAAACVLVVLLAASETKAQPAVVNARVITRSAAGGLQQAISAVLNDQVESAWLAYAVQASNRNVMSGNDGWSERCRLEQTGGGSVDTRSSAGPIRLEPAPTVMVLFRLQNHNVQKVRTFSSDCQIDAGGLTIFWLDGVVPAQSVAYLKTVLADGADRSRSESALSAIALHEDPSAGTVLFELARTGAPRVRERALFWLARRAESRAAATISDAIDRDPDADVKKQAVFALSQLPKDEGVPLLIALARSSTNPGVRRQAFFWLGQSNDPRALAFFEELLR